MPRMRYVGLHEEVEVLRHNGEAVMLKTGDEIDLTEAETKGCAIKGTERPDGIWERVETQGAKGKEKT